MAIDSRLLDLLVCPACHGDVAVDADGDVVACASCGRRYPVRDGIPVMLVDDAEAREPA